MDPYRREFYLMDQEEEIMRESDQVNYPQPWYGPDRDRDPWEPQPWEIGD